MAVFTYVARDDAGKLIEGDVQAASQTEAARIVRGEGKFIIRVNPKSHRAAAAKPKPATKTRGPLMTASRPTGGAATATALGGDKYRPADLIFFTNQLAVMVETGVSMSEALEACVHDGNSPRFAKALAAVIDQVTGGSEFSAALAEHPKVFPPIYISLIKASEASGMMAPMLRRLATHLEAQREMTKKIKGAVTYPIVMFVFAIGVTVFLMTFVLPKFTAIYAGREDKLPTLTKVLLTFSDKLTTYWVYLVSAMAVSVVGAFFYLRSPAGRLKIEELKLKVPLLGPLFHKTYLSRSLRTLGTMIQSGVAMLDSVKLTSTVTGSAFYEQMWTKVLDRLESGQQLSETLSDNPHVPKAINKMLSAGERGGQLGLVMERVAIFCESELNTAIKTMTSLLEPAIVMFLGVVVGGLVLALLLPIFTISKAMH
ncbi:MAG TPA: type II secretion system F family protein [Phycisphaerae bacterium]|nr:type II secretion system F family protein [Phycisphaerae bacterium]